MPVSACTLILPHPIQQILWQELFRKAEANFSGYLLSMRDLLCLSTCWVVKLGREGFSKMSQFFKFKIISGILFQGITLFNKTLLSAFLQMPGWWCYWRWGRTNGSQGIFQLRQCFSTWATPSLGTVSITCDTFCFGRYNGWRQPLEFSGLARVVDPLQCAGKSLTLKNLPYPFPFGMACQILIGEKSIYNYLSLKPNSIIHTNIKCSQIVLISTEYSRSSGIV